MVIGSAAGTPAFVGVLGTHAPPRRNDARGVFDGAPNSAQMALSEMGGDAGSAMLVFEPPSLRDQAPAQEAASFQCNNRASRFRSELHPYGTAGARACESDTHDGRRPAACRVGEPTHRREARGANITEGAHHGRCTTRLLDVHDADGQARGPSHARAWACRSCSRTRQEPSLELVPLIGSRGECQSGHIYSCAAGGGEVRNQPEVRPRVSTRWASRTSRARRASRTRDDGVSARWASRTSRARGTSRTRRTSRARGPTASTGWLEHEALRVKLDDTSVDQLAQAHCPLHGVTDRTSQLVHSHEQALNCRL